jgi:copper oxidase (laccase) domain-containing protein
VLLADAEAGVVGAAHAGWKGALAGVCEATVAAMERLGADRGRIAAAIGPCIAQSSYEVDEAFVARFGTESASFFKPGRDGHAWFDLEGYVAMRLETAGVGMVEKLGLDTYADEARFFSYRRATTGEPGYGRQLPDRARLILPSCLGRGPAKHGGGVARWAIPLLGCPPPTACAAGRIRRAAPGGDS